MDKQEKKPFYKKWWVWIVAFFVIGTLSSMGSEQKTVTQPVIQTPQVTDNVQPTAPQAVQKPVVTQPPVTATPKSYQQVFTFSGNGAKKSEPFTITGDRFKIAYDCKGDFCQAFMFKVGSQLPEVVMNATGAVKDETIMYGSGEYYLNANTMGSYTMTVYDYK